MKEKKEMIEINVSEMKPEDIRVSQLLLEAHDKMWAIGPKRRQSIYHRWEMLKLFTPEMSRLFEQNLRRINRPTS